MKTNAVIVSIFFAVSVVGCSGSNNSSKDVASNSKKQKYFKAVGGQDAGVVPLLGLRRYDNQINAYIVWRECENVLTKLNSSSMAVPVKEFYGPELISPDCTLKVDFDYATGKPVAVGTIKDNSFEREIDITFEEISETEFLSELQSPEVNFLEYFDSQSAFDQKHRVGRMCKDLFDKDCVDVL